MMPTAKKMGRTVLGVRMGLSNVNALLVSAVPVQTHCHAFNLCCLKAVLAGRLLFCFFGLLCSLSSSSIESVCTTCVVDMIVGYSNGDRSAGTRSGTKA